MKSFFSIIIPALNEEVALPKLLSSIEIQTFSSFEVIIVDGGSKDATEHIAMEYKERLKKKDISLNFHLSLAKHIGQQRNKGAETAQGSYLVFLDADVTIAPNFLEHIHSYISTHPNEKLITTRFVPDSSRFLDKTTTAIMNFSIKYSRSNSWPFLLGFDMIIHRQTLDAIGGFNPNLKISEDRELAHRFRLQREKIGYVNDALLTLSLRRHRHEGWLKVTGDLLHSILDLQLKGKINDSLFDYPMGGQYYSKRK